ncbi:GIY-YIG nuclease family protein [Azospirillum argentinense]|uniref:GIY-YIG nuclease family protein n=1 Tax=Azospirillum argentinense TaxID=2970906 RepID=UPI003D7F691B
MDQKEYKTPRHLYVLHAPRLRWINDEGEMCSVIKIGCTYSPVERCKKLQYITLAKLEIIRDYGLWKGPHAWRLEKDIHNSMTEMKYRMDGTREWYAVPDLDEILSALDKSIASIEDRQNVAMRSDRGRRRPLS